MNQPLPRYVDYMYSYPHKTAYRSFPSPVSLVPYLKQVEGQKASLYFHIPFCSHKCGYCNLFSLQTNRADYIATYLETLHKQAQQLSPLTTGLAFDSFAIGGGTPLLLTVPQLEYLLDTAALFGVHPSHTFTSVETSPEYADPVLAVPAHARSHPYYIKYIKCPLRCKLPHRERRSDGSHSQSLRTMLSLHD